MFDSFARNAELIVRRDRVVLGLRTELTLPHLSRSLNLLQYVRLNAFASTTRYWPSFGFVASPTERLPKQAEE